MQWRLISPASRLLVQPFVQAQLKENIKALHHWPLLGEFTGDKRPVAREMFPFHDVIMRRYLMNPLYRSELFHLDSGNGFLAADTMTLPKPMLTSHQRGPVVFTPGKFHRKCLHSRRAHSSAYRDCMLFNNPNSHRTVKHRQRCWLKWVNKTDFTHAVLKYGCKFMSWNVM